MEIIVERHTTLGKSHIIFRAALLTLSVTYPAYETSSRDNTVPIFKKRDSLKHFMLLGSYRNLKSTEIS